MTRTRSTSHFRRAAKLVSVASLVTLAAAATVHGQCNSTVQRPVTDRNYATAITQVQAQIARSPYDDVAMHCLGRLLLDQGQANDAVQWFEKAVALNGRSAPHHLWLGNALRAQGLTASPLRRPFVVSRMKTTLEQAVVLDPSLVEARYGLLQFYTMAPGVMGGGMPKARQQAAELLKLSPMRGHMGYGTVAEQEKDYAAAEKEFLAAVTIAPDSEASYNAAASFYRRRERWTDAVAIYYKLIAANPDAANAHLRLGDVYVNNLKTYDQGEREVRLWLAKSAADPSGTNGSTAHLLLGVVHQQGGRRDQAKVEYQAAIAANPKNEDAKKALASLK
jgi:tetratricopeptide (TPR) repeat protein